LLCQQEQSNVKKDGTTPGQEGLPGVMDYVHCLSLRGVIPDFAKGNRFLEMKVVKDPATVTYLRDPIRGFGAITVGTDRVKQQGFFSPHPNGFNVGYLDSHAKYRTPINEFSDL
jgi:prepilin-type processing-associated H-X9-DG protein